jgi:prevent-host-death family protein
VEEARIGLGDVIDRARLAGEPTLITRYGKPAAVVVSEEWYREAEELLGAAPIRARRLTMAADYAALEARVADLEQQMRHVLPGKIDDVAYAVSLVHEDVRVIREEVGAFRNATQATLGRQSEMLGAHGEMLEEILRRLPSGIINGPS